MFAASKSGSAAEPTDAQFNYVTMLLHGNGTNGAQNNTFVDSSTNNFTITRNGNTTQGTFTPYGSNWSNYFSGSSDYLQLASNSALNMNTYCSFEAWVCYSSLGTSTLIAGRDSSYWLGYNFTGIGGTANKFVFAISNGSSWQAVSSSTTPSVGVWYHVVGVKDNTTLRIYINGTQENTASFSGTAVTSATVFGIGANQNTQNMAGYVSNVRLVLGASSTVLPYTSSFTPSTIPLTAISGTSLLTCQSNRFIDNSTNAFALTANGSPSVQRFSPFSPTTAYSTSVIGGSGYFDGNGDYLDAGTNAAFAVGTGDFTIELWVYPTAFSGTYTGYFTTRTGGQGFDIQILNSSATLMLGNNSGAVISANNVLSLNTWQHICAVRSGSTNSLYVNGTRVATGTDSTNFTDNGAKVCSSGPSGGNNGVGYISNVRLVKGTAVYSPSSSTLTVPTAPLSAVSGTSLLLSYTNAGILDNAMMNDLETVGNAQISTSVKKYGTGSMYFDGAGDNLSTLPSAGALGSGDWTVEFWWQWASATGDYQTVVSKGIVGGTPANGSWSFGPYQQANNIWFAYYNSGFTDVSAAATLNDGAWHHMAASRQGTSLRLFADGVLKVTATLPANLDFGPSTSDPFLVGYNSRNARYINGYVDDLRITKGVARYTATFTPPTATFADKG